MRFFNRFSKGVGSSKVAKSRIQTMLFKDRLNLPANFFDMVVCDIHSAISSYIDLDSRLVDIKVGRRVYDGVGMPVIEIALPVRNVDYKSKIVSAEPGPL